MAKIVFIALFGALLTIGWSPVVEAQGQQGKGASSRAKCMQQCQANRGRRCDIKCAATK
jgi:hypothetical protein